MLQIFKTSFIIVLIMIICVFTYCADDPISSVGTGSIKGILTDAETGSPISGVSVTTSPGTSALISDHSGGYIFSDIDEGSYVVKASKINYQTASVNVAVKKNETTTADIVMEQEESQNDSPNPPTNANPADGAENQPISLTLSWSGSDPNAKDTLRYDVYLGSANMPFAIVSSTQSDTFYAVTELTHNTIFFWQIVAWDNDNSTTYGPVWSFSTAPFPDNRIVFTSNRDGDYEIYSSSNDGTIILQLTDNPNRDWCPKISPNRNKIAFSSNRSVESHIYTMDMDGSNKNKITSIPIDSYHNYGIGFCWSPDGHQLLYSNYDKLYRIEDDGANLTQIAQAPDSRHFRECDWSPLGDKIVALTIGSVIYESQIYIMDADGNNMQILIGDSTGVTGSLSFSPDGRKVVFTHDVSGHEVTSGRQLDSRIFVINIDSTKASDISTHKPAGTNDLYPIWSPDGSKIIFSNGPNDDLTPADIWVMDIDGNNREKLITNAIMPDWK